MSAMLFRGCMVACLCLWLSVCESVSSEGFSAVESDAHNWSSWDTNEEAGTKTLTCAENGFIVGRWHDVLNARGICDEADAGVAVVVQEGEYRLLHGDERSQVVDDVHAAGAVQDEHQVDATLAVWSQKNQATISPTRRSLRNLTSYWMYSLICLFVSFKF